MQRKSRVLLISPNLKGISGGVNRVLPGLGIGYLASVLRDAGHAVHIRDTALEGYANEIPIEGKMVFIGEPDAAIADYIASLAPDIVGISALFSNLMDHSHKIAEIAKQVDPRIITVLGGNHITNAVRDYLFACRNPNACISDRLVDMEDRNMDFAIRGEAEYAFLDFVEKFSRGESIDAVDGLIYRHDTGYKINPMPALGKDINLLPEPARDLMNMEAYFKIGLFHSGKARSKRVLNVMSSRGCPENCTFCTTPLMWGRHLRVRNPEIVFREIKNGIEAYGIDEVQFEDDSLTAHRKNLLKICELIQPLGIYWCTPNGIKVNYHQKSGHQYEMFKRMADSGCYQVTLACESGVQRVLDEIVHKNLKIEQIIPAIENAKRAGLMVHTFWIVGYPGETLEEMERTVEFAASTGADSYSLSILSPLPGTPISHYVAKHKLYWDEGLSSRDIIYRNSLIRVDGFKTPQAFEKWVEEKTLFLNNLLKKKNPEKFAQHYGKDNGARFLLKQT